MSTDTPEPLGAVVEELRRELSRIAEVAQAPAGTTVEAGDAGLDARVRRMSTSAAITADHAPLVRPGRLAPARRAVKGSIRKGLRWYVERLALDARTFADAATDASAALAREVAGLEARAEALEGARAEDARTIAALRDRLARLERGRMAPAPAAAGASPAPAASAPAAAAHAFDYYAFEALMRGSREEIRARQRPYLEHFAGAADVLDAGCGRGEFLELLRDAGVGARGIDLDGDMVEQCRALGLEAERGEVVAHLAGLPAGSLGGLFAAQLVEHLPPDRLVAFLAAAHAALRPGGTLVLETINPASLSALRNYFADLTHAQPLVPETLRFLAESAGFRSTRIEPMSPLPESARLGRVPLGEGVPDAARAALDRDVDLLNDLLFAPQDYALVAEA